MLPHYRYLLTTFSRYFPSLIPHLVHVQVFAHFHWQESHLFEHNLIFLSLQADHRANRRLQDPAGPLRCAEPGVRQASVQASGPLRPDLEAGRPPGPVLEYRYQGPVSAGLCLRPRPLDRDHFCWSQPPETVSGAVLRIRIHMFVGLLDPDFYH
jgi:hypothetical protein